MQLRKQREAIVPKRNCEGRRRRHQTPWRSDGTQCSPSTLPSSQRAAAHRQCHKLNQIDLPCSILCWELRSRELVARSAKEAVRLIYFKENMSEDVANICSYIKVWGEERRGREQHCLQPAACSSCKARPSWPSLLSARRTRKHPQFCQSCLCNDASSCSHQWLLKHVASSASWRNLPRGDFACFIIKLISSGWSLAWSKLVCLFRTCVNHVVTEATVAGFGVERACTDAQPVPQALLLPPTHPPCLFQTSCKKQCLMARWDLSSQKLESVHDILKRAQQNQLQLAEFPFWWRKTNILCRNETWSCSVASSPFCGAKRLFCTEHVSTNIWYHAMKKTNLYWSISNFIKNYSFKKKQ